MNIEKVKEIKTSIERKINRAEKGKDDFVNCVSVDMLKMYLTLINDLENENELLKVGNERFESNMRAILEIEKKQAVKEFGEKLKNIMNDREYMGIHYKQGVFSDNDIDELLKEYEV